MVNSATFPQCQSVAQHTTLSLHITRSTMYKQMHTNTHSMDTVGGAFFSSSIHIVDFHALTSIQLSFGSPVDVFLCVYISYCIFCCCCCLPARLLLWPGNSIHLPIFPLKCNARKRHGKYT